MIGLTDCVVVFVRQGSHQAPRRRHPVATNIAAARLRKALSTPRGVQGTGSSTRWRNDGVAAASSDGGPTGGRGSRAPTVLFYFKSDGRGPDLRK